MKKIILFLLVMVMVISLVACNQEQTAQEEIVQDETNQEQIVEEDQTDNDSEDLVLTLEELSEYDGKDGNPAYVAVDGIIYDFSDSNLWTEGEHNGFEAGQDLTEELREVSPHGESVLDRVPAVGTLRD